MPVTAARPAASYDHAFHAVLSKSGWLPATSDPDLEAARQRHEQLAQALAIAVERQRGLPAEHDSLKRRRQAAYDARARGEDVALPAAPSDDKLAAELADAQAKVDAARLAVAEHAAAVFALIESNRQRLRAAFVARADEARVEAEALEAQARELRAEEARALGPAALARSDDRGRSDPAALRRPGGQGSRAARRGRAPHERPADRDRSPAARDGQRHLQRRLKGAVMAKALKVRAGRVSVVNVRTGRVTQRAARFGRPSPARPKRRLSDSQLLDAAVADGRILASRRAHYARALAADRKGTRRLIASLAPGSPLTDAERERVAAYAGDGTSTDGPWIQPHQRSVPGTIYDTAGHVVVAGSPPPAAPSATARSRRPVAAVPAAPSPPVGDGPVAPRRASVDDDGWTPPPKPPKLRPGTILDESGVVAGA